MSDQEFIPVAVAARKLGSRRGGRPTAPATLIRWAKQGVKAPDGRRVRLTMVKLGGIWCTTELDLGRFFAEVSGRSRPHAATAGRNPMAVECELVRAGL